MGRRRIDSHGFKETTEMGQRRIDSLREGDGVKDQSTRFAKEMGRFLVKKKPHHPFFERFGSLGLISKKAQLRENGFQESDSGESLFFSSIRKGKKKGRKTMISFQFNPTNKIWNGIRGI